VLYIEDNPVNAMLVKPLLARWDDVCFVLAEDGHSGMAQARALLPDLVLLDMQLTEQVPQQLRSHPATRHLRIIALSANAMAEDVDRARQFGANDYWAKPINPARFLAEVRALLGRVSIP
jgi:CheY-like chemotaxis protein